MVFCFYLWVKAVKTGSMAWGGMAALGECGLAGSLAVLTLINALI